MLRPLADAGRNFKWPVDQGQGAPAVLAASAQGAARVLVPRRGQSGTVRIRERVLRPAFAVAHWHSVIR